MRSTRTHAAVAIVVVAMLVVVFSLLMTPGAWRSRPAGSAVQQEVSSKPTSSTPVYRIVHCEVMFSFMVAAAEPAAPADASMLSDAQRDAAQPIITSPPPALAPVIKTEFPPQKYHVELAFFQKPPPSLASDWNRDGAVTMDDLWAFLNGWFAGAGDANKDGQTRPDDVYIFLNAWFDGK